MLTKDDEKFLRADEISNISMLGFFSKHSPTKVLRVGSSIMAKGVSDEEWWYLSCRSTEDFDWFIDQSGSNDRYLACIDNQILERVKQKFTCRWVLSCQRFYFPMSIQLPKFSLKATPALPADAEHIYSNSNYKTFSNVDYIKEQISAGPSSVHRVGDVLAGWVLTHDDGAMGMLHVLDLYRRQGIAKALVVDLIKKIRCLGLMPFTYVEPSNKASMELVKSLGFIPDRSIHWVCLNR